MALLTPLQISLLGLINPTFDSADGGGDTFPLTGGGEILIVKNGGGSPVTVTLDDQGSSQPLGSKSFDPDVDVVIPAGEDAYIKLEDRKRFTDLMSITYSGVTSVTVAVFKP